MAKKLLALTLTLLICNVAIGARLGTKANPEQDAKLLAKVKSGILKIGVGKQSLVALKLRDKKTLAGYVSEINDDSFSITDVKTGATTALAYENVTQVKGHNLSTGAKIAIGAGIAAAIVLLLILRAYCKNEAC
jgi:hypothetical protein